MSEAAKAMLGIWLTVAAQAVVAQADRDASDVCATCGAACFDDAECSDCFDRRTAQWSDREYEADAERRAIVITQGPRLARALLELDKAIALVASKWSGQTVHAEDRAVTDLLATWRRVRGGK